MGIKLILLKSGEDIIADITEMTVGEDDNKRVVGYYLNRPCVVKMLRPEEQDDGAKSGFEVSLFPWMPLSSDEIIPIAVDWLITVVNPVPKLKQMYEEDVVNNGQNDQDDIPDEQSSIGLTD